MLKQLRLRLTLLCACITGVILCVMAVISLAVSETQLAQQAQLSFQNNVNTVNLRIRMEDVLEWSWLTQTETDSGLMLHIEENTQPLLFGGSQATSDSRERLVKIAQEIATNQYDVNVGLRPTTMLEMRQAVFQITDDNGSSYWAAVAVMRTNDGFKSLTALMDMREERSRVLTLRIVFGGIVFLSILLLIGFSWWFSGRAVKPVAESRKRQSEFIAAASHELRAPLAVIRTSVSALGFEVAGDSRRFVEAIDRECIRTSRLVDDLLILASVDARSWSIVRQPVEFDALLREIREDFAPMAEQKEQSLILDLPRNGLPLLAGDEQRLKQMMAAILDNALRYTPQGGKILLKVGRYGRGLRVQVVDNGPGISDEHKTNAFTRFYRGDQSRTRKEHYGLGLSIAWELVRLHGGKISLNDTDGGGLTVTIDLPLKEPKP